MMGHPCRKGQRCPKNNRYTAEVKYPAGKEKGTEHEAGCL